MIWTDELPTPFARRVQRRFAWLPTRMSDEKTVVWLSRYTEISEYHVKTRREFTHGGNFVDRVAPERCYWCVVERTA